MLTVTYKTKLAEGKPYPQLEANAYLELLASKKYEIYTGDFGTYLGREIDFDGQDLYFPFIDIDGDSSANGDSKIENAIYNARLTLKCLQRLGASEFFTLIATGNSGFRLLSNVLLARDSYDAFADFIKREMTQIIDLKPTLEIGMPHQLFVYKGCSLHNHKDLVDRHSAVISAEAILNEEIGATEYKQLTSGRPDPDEVIEATKRIFDFRPIADLSALGDFGKKLAEYRQLVKEIKLDSFNFAAARKNKKGATISLEAMREMLLEKNIQSRIKNRGKLMAIDFTGLPCPACKETTANAWAYPPNYFLRCHNTDCPASSTPIPLASWSGIKTGGTGGRKNSQAMSAQKSPTNFVSKDEARNRIQEAIRNNDNSLIVVTPGIGKSHEALKYLVEENGGKTVFYSCFNRALKQEAYDKALSFSADGGKQIHLLKSLDETCFRKSELTQVIDRGFSPTEILCPSCEYQKDCEYHKQRQVMGPGLYFVTHHMCRYLEAHVPHPDLIILDENLIGGFKLEEWCKEAQIRTLRRVDPKNPLIGQILSLTDAISSNVEEPMVLIVNGRKLTGADSNEDTILSLLATQKGVTENQVEEEIGLLCKKVRETKSAELYNKNVDLRALHWLEGLTSRNLCSYLEVDKAANICFKTKYLTPLGFEGTPIKILDATGDKRIVKSLTGRDVFLVTADVKWDAKKIHIKMETSRKILRRRTITDSDLKRTIERAISRVSATKILLLTYQFLEKRILKIAGEIDPSKEYVGYHFQGPRGINSLSDCDAVVGLGLPFQNLNSAFQDACILSPKKEDEEFRLNWSDLCMGWELIQSIHRIRPVNKPSVEIVLISSFWPPVLPPPDEIIDCSKDKNWKEKAISALEPFVREFGFLTPDVGFLANVYVESKEQKAIWFRSRVEQLLSDYVAHNKMLSRLNHPNSLFSSGRWVNNGGLLNESETFLLAEDKGSKRSHWILDIYNTYIYNSVRKEKPGHFVCLGNQNQNQNQNQNRDEIIAHLILDIYTLYIYDLVRHGKEIFSRLLKANSGEYRLDTTNAISLPNSKQWADLLIHFQEKYPSFEQFEIKLPHTNGKAVKGVGIKKEVLNFHKDLSQLGIIGQTNLQTYKALSSSTVNVPSLPENVLVFHFPENLKGMLSIGFKDEVQSFFIETDGNEIQSFLDGLVEEHSIIITNNGKALVKVFRRLGIKTREIHDIILHERIIKNEEHYKDPTLGHLFKAYELSEKPDSFTLLSQMWQVWVAQKKAIAELHLEQTVRLENRVLWIVAGMETDGIGVDGYGMIEHQGKVRDELSAIDAELSGKLPVGLDWKDEHELKQYLNTTFSLQLTGTSKESLHLLNDPTARSLMESVLRFRSLGKTDKDIERYLALVGDDDRVHDSINQLGAKTGRITLGLQTVKKDGPLRSFFRAAEGYRFVIADYSQFETRVLAGLSKDKAALGIFRNDTKNFFSEVASIGFNVGQSGKLYRQIVKPIVHGLHNGRGVYSIHEALAKEGIDISLDAVEDFIARYQLNFPQFFEWLDRTVKDARQKGYAATPIGRRLSVSSSTDPKSISNFPIQGTASDGFKLALVALDERLQGLDAKIVHTLHDEIIVEAKLEIAETVGEIMKKSMEEAFGEIFKDVPFEVKPVTARSWGRK